MKYITLEHYPNDSRLLIKDDGICQTLRSRMGTGGGNVPLVLGISDDFSTEKISECDSQGYGDMLHP